MNRMRSISIYQSRTRGKDSSPSYVFCGSGERGPGVLVPSKLYKGTENCVELRAEGNWKKEEKKNEKKIIIN